jgi:hypothetical protein
MKKRARIVSGLAALAALFLAPLAEASLSRVSAAERAIEAPALTLASPAAAREPSEFSLFDGTEIARAAAESESGPSFHPLAAVSLLYKNEAERSLVSADELTYPKTRYRVFGFFGAPLIGVERGVSLELHWGSGEFRAGLASGTVGWLSQDPLGDVDSPNLYGFVGMRPHEKTDPLGLLSAGEWFDAIWDATKQTGKDTDGPSRRAALRLALPSPLRRAPGETGREPSLDDRDLLFDLALPHDDGREAQAPKRGEGSGVAPTILLELLDPEGAVSLRCRRAGAAGVPMPEAPVHEDGPPTGAIGQVRRAGEIAISAAVGVAQLSQQLANA